MKKLLMLSLAFAIVLTVPACKKLACKKDAPATTIPAPTIPSK